jgi:hypothetical protein
MNRAETAEEVAAICFEATKHAGGPFYCACGAEYWRPPLHATFEMAAAASATHGMTPGQAASIYRTMVLAR